MHFEREAAALKPLPGKVPFMQVRELSRRVHTDASIELDTNGYSAPWKLIGKRVTAVVAELQVRALCACQKVACHTQSPLRRTTVIDRRHLTGIVWANTLGICWRPRMPSTPLAPPAVLLRLLEQYEQALEWAW